MKLVKNKKELMDFVLERESDQAYDVDSHWAIEEVDYSYPVVIEFLGYHDLGPAYKVRTINEFVELFEEIRKHV